VHRTFGQRPNAIDHSVIAITSANAVCRHAAPVGCAGAFRPKLGEMVMIEAFGFALFSLALGLPGLAMLLMFGATNVQ
jgi:hypothetical protein